MKIFLPHSKGGDAMVDDPQNVKHVDFQRQKKKKTEDYYKFSSADLWEKIREAFLARECRVFHLLGNQATDKQAVIRSTPQILASDLFGPNSQIRTGLHLVNIQGKVMPQFHFYFAHVLMYVLAGPGCLVHNQYANPIRNRLPIKKNDVLIIPRGVRHDIVCSDQATTLTLVAVEYSDQDLHYLEADYQDIPSEAELEAMDFDDENI
jgi:mannose-6-phosphate isomerase-like protein (cupin superfamily)